MKCLKHGCALSCGIMPMNVPARAELVENKSDRIKNGYHSFYYRDKDSQKLKYRFYLPSNCDKKHKYPLVVHFHGAGSRGDNNTSQLCLAQKVTANVNVAKYPCFVFAPQCPAGKKWVDVDWGAMAHKMPTEATPYMTMAIVAIDEIISKYPIDTSRIYVCGQSMGGFATWDIICRCPDMFVAAVPVCAGGDENQASRIAHIPIWIFHGALDPTIKVERSRNMFAALKKAGGTPKYTEYHRVKHNAWSYSYNSKFFDWMFSQSKKDEVYKENEMD